MSDTTLAVGYIRVSTDEQHLSMDAQRERVSAYCLARGWRLAGVVEDHGQSGKSLDRPGMRKVMAMMEARAVDAVVVLKLDRLTRSTPDLHTLLGVAERTRTSLVSVCETIDTGSAAGRLMLNVMTAVAEWEREAIAERTSAALRVKAQRGERVGRHAAIGSKAGEGARAEAEARTLELLRDAVVTGKVACNLRPLSQWLASQGCVSRTGRAYAHNVVGTMLERLAEKHADVRAVVDAERARQRERALAPRLERLESMLLAA
jgi:site-specific DNA recombinase